MAAGGPRILATDTLVHVPRGPKSVGRCKLKARPHRRGAGPLYAAPQLHRQSRLSHLHFAIRWLGRSLGQPDYERCCVGDKWSQCQRSKPLDCCTFREGFQPPR